MKCFFFLCALTMPFAALKAADLSQFTVQKNVAQYKGSDYANVVHVERHISLDRALEIAENNPDIDYFVYTKGYQMVLEIPRDAAFDPSYDPFQLVSFVNFRYDAGDSGIGYCRIFRQGDVVFFKNEGMWLGSAPGLADAYIKIKG
jgi:hypothetical protein